MIWQKKWTIDFASKFDHVFSELQISKTCNSLLRKQIIDLEQSSLDNAEYLRREMIEISPVPLELSNIAKRCSWQEMKYIPVILKHVILEMVKKKENDIVKFNSRKLKYKVINNRKTMKNKSKEMNKLKFSNNLYISESMCAGNHSLLFKCCKLKKARKIFNTWFFSNTINVQLNQSGEIHKVYHTKDLAALLKVNDLDSFLINL